MGLGLLSKPQLGRDKLLEHRKTQKDKLEIKVFLSIFGSSP